MRNRRQLYQSPFSLKNSTFSGWTPLTRSPRPQTCISAGTKSRDNIITFPSRVACLPQGWRTKNSMRTLSRTAKSPIACWSKPTKADSSTGRIGTPIERNGRKSTSRARSTFTVLINGRLASIFHIALMTAVNSSCRWISLASQAPPSSASNSARRLPFLSTKTRSPGFSATHGRSDLALPWTSACDLTNIAPRLGLTFALTSDRKTLLRAGGGLFYDRVPLNVPSFPSFPDRTVLTFDPAGDVTSSVPYTNVIAGGLRNPRSESWNVEVDRQVVERLLVRVAYQQRNTVHDLVLDPRTTANGNFLSLANSGRSFYREFQVTGRYRIRKHTLNASYVRSKASGDLNDFNQFFGNDPQPVIRANARGPLSFDAPNRFLAWGEFAAPWKVTVMPVLDIHSGFPYSVVNEERDFVGPRNDQRYRTFDSLDVQVLREFRLPFTKERKFKAGLGVFNLLDHFNPRDVQNDLNSSRFGEFFNSPPRTFRGKLVFG